MKRHITFIGVGAIFIVFAVNSLKSGYFTNKYFWDCLLTTCRYSDHGTLVNVVMPTVGFWFGVALSVVGLVGAGVSLGLKRPDGDNSEQGKSS